MRRDVVGLHGLVPGAVAGHQPDHQPGLVQQQRGSVRADLERPGPVLAVHPDHLLRRLSDRRLVLRRHCVRTDKRIVVVHCLPIASSVILT